MRSLLPGLMLLCSATLMAEEDTRAYLRSDGGYDFFDFSGMLVGYSALNEKGNYDFFDRQGKRTGWAEAKEGGNRIEFFDASGTLYRVLERSIDGSIAISSASGELYNLAAPNTLGGTDYYDPKGMLKSFMRNGEFVVMKPDKPE